VTFVWATRGHSWGFRFLIDGGFTDPLQPYDRAFGGTDGEPALCRRVDANVALRFYDPLGRRDEAGRVIPHDIVVLPPLANEVRTVEDGQRLIWPRLAGIFSKVWDQPSPPSAADIQKALCDVDMSGSAAATPSGEGRTARG
jgi:hypothetical protein